MLRAFKKLCNVANARARPPRCLRGGLCCNCGGADIVKGAGDGDRQKVKEL
jgi:hypothetical protein